MRLKGKTALIAGGASGIEGQLMGIGGATARLFAREGAQVVIADLKDDAGKRTVDEIVAEGGEASYVHLDVTDEQQWKDAICAAVNTFGKLDVLVDAAGTSLRNNVENTTVEEWDLEMAVHAKGAFLGTKHAIPEMRRIGGGSIIIVSSMLGATSWLMGWKGYSVPYSSNETKNDLEVSGFYTLWFCFRL